MKFGLLVIALVGGAWAYFTGDLGIPLILAVSFGFIGAALESEGSR